MRDPKVFRYSATAPMVDCDGCGALSRPAAEWARDSAGSVVERLGIPHGWTAVGGRLYCHECPEAPRG